MKISYNDLTDTRNPAYRLLSSMTDKAKNYEEEAARARELNRRIVCMIQEGKVDDTKSIECALSWLHYCLTIDEILERCI